MARYRSSDDLFCKLFVIKSGNPLSFILLLGLLSLLPLAGSSVLFFLVSSHPVFFEALSPFGMLLFYFLMIFTMAAALTPTTFVAFISGYLFSWFGFPLMVIAYLLAAALGMSLGKFFSKDLIEKITGNNLKWKTFVKAMEKRMFLLNVFARLSPVMPFAMVNVALSSLLISRKNYFLGTLLGMLPRTFLFFWIGKNAGAILFFFEHPSGEGFYKLIPVLLVLISLFGIIFLLKKSWGEVPREE